MSAVTWRAVALYGALLLLAAAVALQARSQPPESGLPSIDNARRRGVRGLFLYLREGGHDVRSWTAPLTALDREAARLRTLVLVAPISREVLRTEREALERFVKAGGTLVYLTPASGGLQQPELVDWLSLRIGRHRRPDGIKAGLDLEVWHPHGLFEGVGTLRTGAARAIATDAEGAVAVAGIEDGAHVWRLGLGEGEIWLFSGADLAQNRWLDGGEVVTFWERLARRGPLAFDEHHHTPAPLPPASPVLWGVALQLAAVALLFLWTRGTRLGPPRVAPAERHRAMREYLDSFGWLLRRAHVERELLLALEKRTRHRLWEQANVPPSAPAPEAAHRWAAHTGQPPARFLHWAEAMARAADLSRVSPRLFAKLSAEAAELEGAT